MKRLADSNDDDYLSSSWADSKQLQRNLQGTGGVIIIIEFYEKKLKLKIIPSSAPALN